MLRRRMWGALPIEVRVRIIRRARFIAARERFVAECLPRLLTREVSMAKQWATGHTLCASVQLTAEKRYLFLLDVWETCFIHSTYMLDQGLDSTARLFGRHRAGRKSTCQVDVMIEDGGVRRSWSHEVSRLHILQLPRVCVSSDFRSG